MALGASFCWHIVFCTYFWLQLLTFMLSLSYDSKFILRNFNSYVVSIKHILARHHIIYVNNISVSSLNWFNTRSLVVCDIPLRNADIGVKSISFLVPCTWTEIKLKPILDEGSKRPPTSFAHVTSTNVGLIPQKVFEF